jgi:hypothetical protein
MTDRTIEVDDEVYAFLENEARSFVETSPNDVLRRLLLAKAARLPSAGVSGLLKPLLDDEKLIPGDRLVHHQPRKRRTFYAEVTADGFLQIEDGRRFAKPSPALRECVGHQVNGWDHWIVERIGCSLKDLQ